MNSENTNIVCKFFVKGNCKDGNNCKYLHDKNVCRYFFLNGKCRDGDKCNFKHVKNENNHKRHKKKKNTESFEPSHKPPDMRIIVENGGNIYPRKHRSNDVIIINNLFQDQNHNNNIYHNLLKEIKESDIDNDKLWKLWHGDTHLIVDDKLGWKSKCPTFNMVISRN